MPAVSSTKKRGDFVEAIGRGLAVLTVFSRSRSTLTLTEVAKLVGISRPTARRVLLTLQSLGYLRSEGRKFELTAKVLDLSSAYFSSLGLGSIAQPEMERLVEDTHESCSVSVLEGTDIVYVARVPTRRIMTISLGLGSRLPAYASAMGRVLLADLPEDHLQNALNATRFQAFTSRTIVDRRKLEQQLATVRVQGWALVDQELEEGLRSIAAPLRNTRGRTVAAMNLGTHTSRVSLERLRKELLPLLMGAASRVNELLASLG